MIHFVLADRAMLASYIDEVTAATHSFVRKTGGHSHDCESVMKMMFKTTGRDDGFLMFAFDEYDRFRGYVYAVLVSGRPAWVDVVAMQLPNMGARMKHEAFKVLRDWSARKGAGSILAGITRAPETFLKFFYEPLGFKKIGLIVKYNMEDS